jgi:hypothetical protein
MSKMEKCLKQRYQMYSIKKRMGRYQNHNQHCVRKIVQKCLHKANVGILHLPHRPAPLSPPLVRVDLVDTSSIPARRLTRFTRSLSAMKPRAGSILPLPTRSQPRCPLLGKGAARRCGKLVNSTIKSRSDPHLLFDDRRVERAFATLFESIIQLQRPISNLVVVRDDPNEWRHSVAPARRGGRLAVRPKTDRGAGEGCRPFRRPRGAHHLGSDRSQGQPRRRERRGPCPPRPRRRRLPRPRSFVYRSPVRATDIKRNTYYTSISSGP